MLLRVSMIVYCFVAFACVARVNSLYSLSICFFLICRIKCVVSNAACLLPTHETVISQMLHVFAGLLSLSNLKYFSHCRHFIHRLARVACASAFCHKLCSDVTKKINT